MRAKNDEGVEGNAAFSLRLAKALITKPYDQGQNTI